MNFGENGLGGDSAGLGTGPREEVPEVEAIGPRDFVVVQPDSGPVDHSYRIGRTVCPLSQKLAGVIAITIIDEKVLVAVPEAVWHRVPAKRLLPPKALGKPILCAVAVCHSEERERILDEGLTAKVWFGLASPEFEASLDFVTEEEIDYGFSPLAAEPLLPSGAALVDVANSHFSFFSAESEIPECPAPFPGGQEHRIQLLEDSLGKIHQSLAKLTGEGKPTPKQTAKPATPRPGAAGRTAAAQKPSGSLEAGESIPGLDQEAVQAALAAGVPMVYLREMGAVLGKKPKRLEELPRGTGTKARAKGPLSESEDEPELIAEDEEDFGGESGQPVGGEKSEISQAIVQLTAIAKNLTSSKEKKDKVETLLEGSGGGGAFGTESSSSSGGRKNSAVVRALQKVLVEDPKYLYERMEANMQSDFLARPVQPGEPMPANTSVRGWLASRSRIQNYTNHVRWSWQIAGVWDCLIQGRTAEARARCALMMAAADQASIDGGSWVVANVALLESPPPFQAFANHLPPSALELQHSVHWSSSIQRAARRIRETKVRVPRSQSPRRSPRAIEATSRRKEEKGIRKGALQTLRGRCKRDLFLQGWAGEGQN